MGSYQADALQNITGKASQKEGTPGYFTIADTTGAFAVTDDALGQGPNSSSAAGRYRGVTFDAGRVARVSTETRGASAAVAPVVLI